MKFDYYKAPPQKVFDDIKENAIKIWLTYDNTHSYGDEKVGRIKNMRNIRDNAWFIVAMFDSLNQAKLIMAVKQKTSKMIMNALTDG